MTSVGSGKKTILLLGGARHQVCAIERAKALGYRTVLCDYLPDNPGQYVADVFYQKSTTDRERILEVARRERIDGILSFGSDVALPTAGYVAETLGLPTNSLASIEALSEKGRFRTLLRQLGLPCPAFALFEANDSVHEVRNALAQLSYPIIMKPTDSSGSKGVSVLHADDEAAIAQALASARAYSRNGRLIAEEFVEQTYPHIIGGDIFVLDGIVTFWGLMRAIRDKSLGGLVPVGEAYPCGLPTETELRVRTVLQELVSGLGLRFGEMNVEVLIGPDDESYVIELAGRAGGNMIPVQLGDLTGIDLVEASVLCAMGEKPSAVSFDRSERAYATYMLHAAADGVLRDVFYREEIRDCVYREELFYERGSRVQKLSNSSDNVGIVYLRFDDSRHMDEMLPCLPDYIRVVVED